MDNNINDIDKFFKDRLDGFESPNVPGAWDSMAAMLDADDKGAAIAAKNVNRFILASIAGTIVLAASIIGYISGYNTNTTIAENVVTAKENSTVQAPTKEIITEDITTENNTTTGSNNASIVDNNTTNSDATVDAATPAPKQPANAATSAPKTPVAKAPATPETTKKPTTTKTPPIPVVVVEEEEKPTVVVEEEAKPETVVETATSFTKKEYTPILLSPKNAELETNFEGLGTIKGLALSDKLQIDSALNAQRRISKMARFYRLQFGIQAGANFNRVINNSNNNFEVGSGIMAGFFFGKNISKKWGVNAELNYYRSVGNSISRNINQTEFFLEKTTTNFFLVTKTLDYLQVPISVSFSPTETHKFSAGIASTFLLNAKTEVAENREKINEKSSVTTTKNGVYEDLNTFNYGLLLGYEYNLPGMYSIGLRYNQMFRDLTNNSYFNDNKKHLPANVQLFVKLNLTR